MTLEDWAVVLLTCPVLARRSAGVAATSDSIISLASGDDGRMFSSEEAMEGEEMGEVEGS